MKNYLVSTTQLMRELDVKSYSTIQKLEDNGIIHPVRVGRNKKWDLEKCIESIKNLKNEKAAV